MEKLMFFCKFIKSPGTVGSVIPSSRFLSRAMTKPIDWKQTRSIVELGAGTGSITQYIHQLKNPDCLAVVFERDPDMQAELKTMFPGFQFRDHAERLPYILEQLGVREVDAIISSLPFTNFSEPLRNKILDGIIQTLKPGGLFITYQYSLHMKDQLEKVFDKVSISLTLLNIPPAFVYICHKKEDAGR